MLKRLRAKHPVGFCVLSEVLFLGSLLLGERSDVKVCKVNVDEQVELAQAFGVSSIPTLAVISGGKLVNHAVGAQPKSAILDMLDAVTK